MNARAMPTFFRCAIFAADSDNHPHQATHARRRRVSRWAIGPQPRCSQAAPHRGHRLVDEKILEYRAAEGPADERGHRLSQCRAPLSPRPKCEKCWIRPMAADGAAQGF